MNVPCAPPQLGFRDGSEAPRWIESHYGQPVAEYAVWASEAFCPGRAWASVAGGYASGPIAETLNIGQKWRRRL